MARTLNRQSAAERKTRGADGKADSADPERAQIVGHNAKARRAMYRDKHRELTAIEAKEDDLRVKMKAFGKEKSNIYREVKSELGVSRTDFEVMRRVVQLSKDEREETVSHFQEIYESLRPGEQMSFLQDTAAELTATARIEIHAAGVAAGKAGKNLSDCPHEDGEAAELWQNGWTAAQREMAEGLGGGQEHAGTA